MGAVDVGGGKKPTGAGPSWKRPRIPIRIDMTPMVDIAFLLLIFFMVTTVFRLPQAMEMVLPEDDSTKVIQKIQEQKLVTFLVLESDSLAYFIGRDPPKPLLWDSLRAVLLERREAIGDSLTVLARIHKNARYSAMVNMVDEFNVARTTRFSIDRFTTYEDSLLRAAGFQTSGPADLPEPEYVEVPAEGS